MTNEPPSLPADLAAAHAVILAQWNARRQAEAMVSAASLEIQRLKLLLAKARRESFGQTSERSKRLLDQLELQLTELEERDGMTKVSFMMSSERRISLLNRQVAQTRYIGWTDGKRLQTREAWRKLGG